MSNEIQEQLEKLDLTVTDNFIVIIDNGNVRVEEVSNNDIFEVKFTLGVL